MPPLGILSAVQRYQCSAQDIKAARATLQSMVRSLDNELETLVTTSHPKYLEYGLSSAPDDVLAVILTLSYADSEDTRNLGQVCTRFHRIASSLPLLWSSVSTDTIQADLERSLRLSREQPLTVTIDEGASNLDKALVHLVCHSERWRALELSVHDMNVETLRERCTGLRLSQLEELKIVLDDVQVDAMRQEEVLLLYSFYSTWHAPLLRNFHAKNIIPQPISGMALTSVSIELDEWMVWIQLPSILLFLSECPSLRELSLDSSQASVMDMDDGNGGQEVVLHSLEKFTLKIFPCGYIFWRDGDDILDRSNLGRFLDGLVAPKLAVFDVGLVLDGLVAPNVAVFDVGLDLYESDILNLFLTIIFRNNRYGTTNEVRLAVKEIESYTPLIWYAFCGRPQLAHAVVEIPEMHLTDSECLDFAALQTFTFKKCYYLREYCIMNLIHTIRAQREKHNNRLPLKLIFVDCPIAERLDWTGRRNEDIIVEVVRLNRESRMI